ncbi:MAG TPA: APC family permease [Thermoanaerobaculia bacterium]|nr:APC family permease [Thermoanaerobaculia bacterium]
MKDARPETPLRRALTGVEYFTFGFGTMIGVGWLVLIDDWLARGGPGGAAIAFAAGALLLAPIARTYGRLVEAIPDAGAEIAYAEGVFPMSVGFSAAWTMVLAYAIVCPWEAVAVGNLLARVFPALDRWALYTIAGKTVYAPRLAAGLLLTAGVAAMNLRGIRASARLQNAATFGLLSIFALFTVLGFARGHPGNAAPLFARPGAAGAGLSILLALQVVPYFLTGFESISKESEEAHEDFDPRHFRRAIAGALAAGATFYVAVIGAVSFVFPWRDLVAGHLGTEAAFRRAFGSDAIARTIVFAAFLSLLKIFNGNFVAATRLLVGIGRRDLVHPALGRVDARRGAPIAAIVFMAVFTALASLLGDALLVPVTEVGSLAVGIGWGTACLAAARRLPEGRAVAYAGAAVAGGIVLMKVLPFVPGSFTRAEWIALLVWTATGTLFWIARPRANAS